MTGGLFPLCINKFPCQTPSPIMYIFGEAINNVIIHNDLQVLGEAFAALKKIHMEIKELECHLKVMEWKAADKARTHSRYYQLKQWPLL
jgi:hypothetical protein